MGDQTFSDDASMPLADRERIEEVCMGFETAWKAGKRPRIEEMVADTQGPVRDRLLYELLVLELDYRLRDGEAPTEQEYHDRFSEDSELILKAFANARQIGNAGRPDQIAEGLPETVSLPPCEHVSDSDEPAPTSQGQSRLRERANRLVCPHCNNRVQLVEPRPKSCTCTKCGKTFEVDPRLGKGSRPDDLPKTIGRFDVKEYLGRGSFGTVYKAFDSELHRDVAIKIPREGYFRTSEDQLLFVHEARSAAQLKHGSIVPVHDIAYQDGAPYIVSDFIEGTTLAHVVKRRRLDFREAADVMAQIADAVDYAHSKGVLHRDIKPANILMDYANRPHLTDFGLAQRDEAEFTVGEHGQVIGTPAYMSPEQARGDNPNVDRRSDVYSLGVVLYELLTRALPFQGGRKTIVRQVLDEDPPSPRSSVRKIPRDLETICLKAMSKQPSRRYHTARAFADDLRRWLVGQPILARPIGRLARVWRWCKRKPAVAAVAALALFIIVGAPTAAFAVLYYQSVAKNHEIELSRSQERERTQKARTRDARYAMLVNRAREANSRGKIGSSWESERDLAEAAQIDTPLRDAFQLRTELASTWARVDLRQERTLAQQFGAFCMAVSPSGGRLAIGRWKQLLRTEVRLVDLSDKQQIQQLFVPAGLLTRQTGIRALAFSADGRLLAAGTRGGAIRVWETETGRQLAALTHAGNVTGLAFGRDGKTLFSAGENKLLKRWSATTWQPDGPPFEFEAGFSQLAINPTRTLLACATGYGALLCDLSVADAWRKPRKLLGGSARRVCFTPDGEMLIVGGDKRIQLVDIQSGDRIRAFTEPHTAAAHEGQIDSLDVHPSGSLLLSVGNGEGKMWDMASGTRIASFPLSHKGNVYGLFTSDGRYVAVTGCVSRAQVQQPLNAQDDEQTVLYELGGLRERTFVAHHARHVKAIAFDPSGRTLATVAETRPSGAPEMRIAIWDIATSRLMSQTDIAEPTSDGSTSLVFHPSGQWLATNGENGVFLVNAATGQQRTWRASEINALSFSPTGDALWVAHDEYVTRIPKPSGVQQDDPHELTSDLTWTNLEAHFGTGRVGIVGVSAGSQSVVAVSRDETVKLFRAKTGADESTIPKTATWQGSAGPLRCVALSPDESLAAFGAEEGALHIVAIPSGEARFDAPGAHASSIESVTFGVCGEVTLLASGSKDGVVSLWSCTHAGFEKLIDLRCSGPVASVVLSKDCKELGVLLQDDYAVRIWHLEELRGRFAKLGLDW